MIKRLAKRAKALFAPDEPINTVDKTLFKKPYMKLVAVGDVAHFRANRAKSIATFVINYEMCKIMEHVCRRSCCHAERESVYSPRVLCCLLKRVLSSWRCSSFGGKKTTNQM